MKRTPTYNSWRSMRQRCLNPNHEYYYLYGGRGITICDRWKSYSCFHADMGERPPGKTLDRWPDPNGNYHPKNCRWATPQEQSDNADNHAKGWHREAAHCVNGHAFTPSNTRMVGTERQCRACDKKRARRRALAKEFS